jgi:hypothetical protein
MELQHFLWRTMWSWGLLLISDFEAASEVCSAWPYPFESSWMPRWYIKPRDFYFGIQKSVKLFSATSDQYSHDVTGQWNEVLLSREWGDAVGVGAHKLDTFLAPVQGFCAFEYSGPCALHGCWEMWIPTPWPKYPGFSPSSFTITNPCAFILCKLLGLQYHLAYQNSGVGAVHCTYIK